MKIMKMTSFFVCCNTHAAELTSRLYSKVGVIYEPNLEPRLINFFSNTYTPTSSRPIQSCLLAPDLKGVLPLPTGAMRDGCICRLAD